MTNNQPKYAVGDVLPDLTVSDLEGQPTPLSAQMGDAGLLLVVLRGTWCPFCVGQIHAMRRYYPRFRELGINLVFVVPEDQARVWSFAVSSPEPLPFALHADERIEITDDLTMVPETPSDRPLALYLLRPNRRIVWRYIGDDAETYPSYQQLLVTVTEHLHEPQRGESNEVH